MNLDSMGAEGCGSGSRRVGISAAGARASSVPGAPRKLNHPGKSAVTGPLPQILLEGLQASGRPNTSLEGVATDTATLLN